MKCFLCVICYNFLHYNCHALSFVSTSNLHFKRVCPTYVRCGARDCHDIKFWTVYLTWTTWRYYQRFIKSNSKILLTMKAKLTQYSYIKYIFQRTYLRTSSYSNVLCTLDVNIKQEYFPWVYAGTSCSLRPACCLKHTLLSQKEVSMPNYMFTITIFP